MKTIVYRGKEQIAVARVPAGDIGAVARLSETQTGDTLCDRGVPLALPSPTYPNPLFSVAVTPKTKALTPEQQRIQELERQVNRLEREKAILKKATALLMSDEIDRTR